MLPAGYGRVIVTKIECKPLALSGAKEPVLNKAEGLTMNGV